MGIIVHLSAAGFEFRLVVEWAVFAAALRTAVTTLKVLLLTIREFVTVWVVSLPILIAAPPMLLGIDPRPLLRLLSLFVHSLMGMSG